MRAFITVGSTKFDTLIHQVLSKPVLETLRLKGYYDVTVQCGNSHLNDDLNLSSLDSCAELELFGVKIDIWRFKPSLQEDYTRADLVISHAGEFYAEDRRARACDLYTHRFGNHFGCAEAEETVDRSAELDLAGQSPAGVGWCIVWPWTFSIVGY